MHSISRLGCLMVSDGVLNPLLDHLSLFLKKLEHLEQWRSHCYHGTLSKSPPDSDSAIVYGPGIVGFVGKEDWLTASLSRLDDAEPKPGEQCGELVAEVGQQVALNADFPHSASSESSDH